MKKLALLAFALLFCAGLQAQQIRANYRVDGMTHISTEAEKIKLGNTPAQVKLELVGFPDGSTLYLMYMTLLQEKKASSAAPKGVKMAVNLANGKFVRLEQIGQYPASTKNTQLKYAVEPADMEKMVKGIKSVDIVTGWEPEDYVQASFANNELGAFFKRHCEAILKAAPGTVELKATLAERQDNLNSTMTTTNPLMAKGKNYDYNILISQLTYKTSEEEDIDLYFAIGSEERFHIPFDSSVRFLLKDGSSVGLLQARDDVNFVLVYPSAQDLDRMVKVGVSGLSIDYEGGTLTDSFPEREDGEYTFSGVLAQLQQLIYYIRSL